MSVYVIANGTLTYVWVRGLPFSHASQERRLWFHLWSDLTNGLNAQGLVLRHVQRSWKLVAAKKWRYLYRSHHDSWFCFPKNPGEIRVPSYPAQRSLVGSSKTGCCGPVPPTGHVIEHKKRVFTFPAVIKSLNGKQRCFGMILIDQLKAPGICSNLFSNQVVPSCAA